MRIELPERQSDSVDIGGAVFMAALFRALSADTAATELNKRRRCGGCRCGRPCWGEPRPRRRVHRSRRTRLGLNLRNAGRKKNYPVVDIDCPTTSRARQRRGWKLNCRNGNRTDIGGTPALCRRVEMSMLRCGAATKFGKRWSGDVSSL